MLKLFNKKILCRLNTTTTIVNNYNIILSSIYKNSNFKFCDKKDISDDGEDTAAQDKTEYDFVDAKYSLYENNLGMNNIINNTKCQGCGIHLQTEDKTRIGYIPQKKVQEYINASDNKKNEETEIKEEQSEGLKEFELIHDKATLKRIMKLKNSKNVIICERCYKLKNYSSFEELNNTKGLKEKKNDDQNEKINNYTFLVKKINDQRLIHQIMARISNRAHIFYICDVSELEATINKNILKEIKNKNIPLTFIINKFDILPTKVIPERVRVWVGEFLKEFTKDIEGLVYTYILVSSKNGYNFDHVIHKIKTIKENAKEMKTPRPKIFVLGNTNVGKSSFINKLIYRSNKHMDGARMARLAYKKDYRINEQSIFEKEEDWKKEESHLTASPLPGTTIGITKIESMKMGVKLFDTPGIPNKHSINYIMNNYTDIVSSTISHQIIPFTASVKQGYSIWIGAIARIDFLNGEDKYLSFFFSNHVTIHRTPLLNAEEMFHKHAGTLLRPSITTDLNKLNLVKHTFNLKCDIFSLLNFDIAIAGLGWFSISGKGLVQIEVNVPEGVSVFLRNKPLMPYEIKSRGVKKFFGKTINANSKINRKFTQGISVKKSGYSDKSNNKI